MIHVGWGGLLDYFMSQEAAFRLLNLVSIPESFGVMSGRPCASVSTL